MIVWIILLLVSLYLLYKVSEKTEEELVKFAEYSGITHLSVGFIFLAAATSLPELSISISSVFVGNREISAGVSIGNVLYDLLLILPIVAIWCGLKVDERNFRKIKQLSLISLLSLFPITILKSIERIYGLALVISFILLSRYLLQEKAKKQVQSTKEERFRNKMVLSFSLISLSFLSFLINLSTKKISEATKISSFLIGSIIVSIATSSSEFFACLAAGKRKNYGIVIGTIYGTLVFDTMFVIGSTSLLTPITFSNVNQFLFLYCFLFVSLISIILMLVRKREIGIDSSLFLLMIFALWIFLSILIGI
jgi:cation:H+ antiporter